MSANGTAPDTTAPDGAVSTDWQEILDYITATWAQRMAETVTEAARWRAVASASQRALTDLQARVAALEAGHEPDHAAAAR